jgi:hypothetical protein
MAAHFSATVVSPSATATPFADAPPPALQLPPPVFGASLAAAVLPPTPRSDTPSCDTDEASDTVEAKARASQRVVPRPRAKRASSKKRRHLRPAPAAAGEQIAAAAPAAASASRSAAAARPPPQSKVAKKRQSTTPFVSDSGVPHLSWPPGLASVGPRLPLQPPSAAAVAPATSGPATVAAPAAPASDVRAFLELLTPQRDEAMAKLPETQAEIAAERDVGAALANAILKIGVQAATLAKTASFVTMPNRPSRRGHLSSRRSSRSRRRCCPTRRCNKRSKQPRPKTRRTNSRYRCQLRPSASCRLSVRRPKKRPRTLAAPRAAASGTAPSGRPARGRVSWWDLTVLRWFNAVVQQSAC